MADKAQKEKEKGNAAFKAGDYPSAIGHYTAAVLADPKDHTYPLNRAAAYLKLGKFEDAERDCTKVLNLSPKNVKAYFRRGQANVGQSRFIEARRDFTEALKLEPDNKTTKEELRKIAERIETDKRKKSDLRQVDPISKTAPESTPAPKRRRVPIAIVDPSAYSSTETTARTERKGAPIEAVKPSSSGFDIQEVASRTLKDSDAAATASGLGDPPTPQTPPATSPSSKAASFTKAKEFREAKITKVGGGIFRASGQHTIFPTRTVGSPSPTSSPDPAVKPENGESFAPVEELLSSIETPPQEKATALSGSSEDPNPSTPATLFDLIRAWRSILTSVERWKLLQTIAPSKIPSFFKTSLETTFLVSILEVFLVVLSSQPTPDDTHSVRDYMDNLSKVARFPTLVMFLSGKEKAIAREVWRKLGSQDKAPGAWNVLGSLRS
ncbi:hypothetical protein Agabi119p4_7169 [Agaricus bisporus var. burnettii]|uniref:RNA polymerase II-associated protein 3 n=1 Tax=Agaricus bisporus var. burnettii TaxID=192524 RepID=A0A8H7C7L0_AGABI|nr:hypothetical protein Agabi119p4_7169 [Agaricus bisporus var. burnettii]